MKISKNLVVEYEGAKFTFEAAGLNDWASIAKLGEVSIEQQVDIVLNKLQSAEGVEFEDGEVICLEEIKGKTLPGDFYTTLMKKWLEGVTGKIKAEAETGNAETAA